MVHLISHKELMLIHVEALFTSDEDGRLLVVNEPRGGTAPRFFLGRTADGNVFRFRYDVSTALANDLRVLCESQPSALEVETVHAAPFIERLSLEEPVNKIWVGPAFHFPPDLRSDEIALRVTPDNVDMLSPFLDDWRSDVMAGLPTAVVLQDGKAVSICCSVRVTSRAHEAGVETHPDFRGRGYAAPAVTAWARIVREMDRIPLYSTSWGNQSSRALAKKLGLIQFGADLHIT